jgi:hypothetical protein
MLRSGDGQKGLSYVPDLPEDVLVFLDCAAKSLFGNKNQFVREISL